MIGVRAKSGDVLLAKSRVDEFKFLPTLRWMSATSLHSLLDYEIHVHLMYERVFELLSGLLIVICPWLLKVTGDSLLIHAFAYSLFIGLVSVTSNMTGWLLSFVSFDKLIHCGAPQRDALSDSEW